MAEPSKVATLDEINRTPLDQIRREQSAQVVRDVLRRDSNDVAVDVARFGSCI